MNHPDFNRIIPAEFLFYMIAIALALFAGGFLLCVIANKIANHIESTRLKKNEEFFRNLRERGNNVQEQS